MKSINAKNSSIFFVLALLFTFLFNLNDLNFSSNSNEPSKGNNDKISGSEESEERSIEMRKNYMESFYYPKTLEEVERERSEYLQTHATFENLSPDYQSDNPIPWSCVGPFGIITGIQPPSYHAGRIISFAMYGDNTNNLFVGGASGGLWKSTNGGGSWYNLLDTLSCPSVSSIATSYLLIDNTVWISTGAGFNEGDGTQIGRVYKSTNGGATWQQITGIPGFINYITKIEVNVFNKNFVYIATNAGLYKTTNGGNNFSLVLSGTVTDVISYTNLLAPDTTNIIAAVIGGSYTGISRSTNGGANFFNVTLPGAIPSVINRISLTRDPATSKTYALVGRNNGKFMGIWYSTDKGATWSQKTFPSSDSGGQSNFNQGIAVAPNGRVYVGYNDRNIYYSSNNGSTWQLGSSIHEDVHKIHVYNNSLVIHVSDGGIFKSSDQGISWMDGGNNWLPLSESYHLTADYSEPNLIWTGLQDNGLVTGYDGLFRWTNLACCDAGDYLPFAEYQYMNIVGIGESNKYQRKLLSAPPSASWEDFTSGLPPGNPSSQAGINDIIYNSFSLYTSMNQFVFKTTGMSLPWIQLGGRPHPTTNWYVGKILPIANYVLAGFDQAVNPTLRRYNNSTGNWETPDLTGIPSGTRVTDFNEGNIFQRVFMTVSGTGAPRVFKSTNSGSSWINITGDLPNAVNARCLLIDHNSNDTIIYVGSDFGVFCTTNGGSNWFNYSSGLPSVCYVNDMEFAAGHASIYAATYGRSVWKTSAIIGIINISEIAENYSLSQNYPNPFNPKTIIQFSVPKTSFVKLVIYDIQGREVETIVNEKLNHGTYKADWNAANYSSGVYLYKLITEGYTETKKMILLK